MAAVGQPPKLNDKRQAMLVDAFQNCLTVEAACAEAGIGQTTYYRWMAKGRDQGDKHPRYREFWKAIKSAQGTGEGKVVRKLMDLVDNKDRGAIFFLLERRYGWKSGGDLTPIEPPVATAEAIDPTAPDAAEQLAKQLAEKLPGDVLARAVEISQGEVE